ncbi:flagellar hook-basal body complex protein FliE [Zooshikella ganghwensis]|uniref:Flagellar hook-basal body complex protein FliE n=1 Tax=Zooshikella ganghwensis TaxID=202772 RepID=A0A4P9VVM3_9GAMM|nr:flagellar hook-basal body complex protein FliE [Zooshikella ganghwensis]RDH46454.1 flagellar hook-basal body complex protein FliE [Zooshikella ganghwensis]
MNIESIEAINGISYNQLQPKAAISGSGFDAIIQQINSLDQQYKTAESSALKMASGEIENLHQVMQQIDKASRNLNLAIQVRNKCIEGLQEIMRLQV